MLEFFVDEAGLVLVGVRIQFGLLVVIHHDTATTFDIRPVAGCTPCEPLWQGDELHVKLYQWRHTMRLKLEAGVEALLKDTGGQ